MLNETISDAIALVMTEMVAEILQSGECDVNEPGLTGDPLILECVQPMLLEPDEMLVVKKCETLKLLVDHGANVNILGKLGANAGKSAALVCAEGGPVELLQVLVESGADLSVTSPDGYTALMAATAKNNIDCVRYLLQHMSADLLNYQNSHGRNALMLAVSDRRPTTRRSCLCVYHFLKASVDINAKDKALDTALMFALRNSCFQVAEMLLAKQAFLNTVNFLGETPLTLALCESPTLIMKLFDSGLDPTVSRRDRYALHAKIMNPESYLVRSLVMNGFPPLDLDCTEEARKELHAFGLFPILGYFSLTPLSPLAVALGSCRPDIARYLIVNGFLTVYDVSRLCSETGLFRYLHDKLKNDKPFESQKTRHCLEILAYLSGKPRSLRDLCCTAVSSILSKDFASILDDTQKGDPDRLCFGSLVEMFGGAPDDAQARADRWACRPTFQEKVKSLPLPPPLQRLLLHQTPSAAIHILKWDQIRLE